MRCGVVFWMTSRRSYCSAWEGGGGKAPATEGGRYMSGNGNLQPAGEESARLDDSCIALRSGGDHADFDLQEIGDEAEIVDCGFRELAGIFNAVSGFAPAGKRLIDGRDEFVDFRGGGHFVNGRSLVVITDADFDFALGVEDVELGDHQRIDAVDHFGVAEFGQVQPAAAPRASGDRAKFLAAFADFLGFEF